MLWIDVGVNNEEPFESIRIQRQELKVGHINTYKIVRPEGHGHKIIKHRYTDGYKPLLIKALRLLEGG